MPKSIKELAAFVNGAIVGDGNVLIEGITNLEAPHRGHITFAQDEKVFLKLENTDIACLIVPPSISKSSKPLIQVKNPKLAWAKLVPLFYPKPNDPAGISPKASISPTSRLAKNTAVEAFATICDGVEIGEGGVIRSHAFIGEKVKIGKNAVVHPGVVIYRNCVIGDQVILHAGAVIGADGFGYVTTETRQEKVPQVGNVVIEDDVEIGALTSIDRATIGSTRIGKGTKIDNLVQVGHNVSIGAHTVISAQTGISGSCKIGSHVTMGGKVGLGDHVEIGDWVTV